MSSPAQTLIDLVRKARCYDRNGMSKIIRSEKMRVALETAKQEIERTKEIRYAALDYLMVTRTRGNGDLAHIIPPANRTVFEVRKAERRLRNAIHDAQDDKGGEGERLKVLTQ